MFLMRRLAGLGCLERREIQDLKDTKESSVYQGQWEMLETMDHQVLKVLLVPQEKLAQMEQMDPKAQREVLAQRGSKEPGAQWGTKVPWERPALLVPRVEKDG